jgi:hypothetical protein
MNKEQDIVKMEFLLTLNDKIIVQRYFNVRDFNEDAKNSLELYEYVLEISNNLKNELCKRTTIYMLDNIDEIMMNENIMNTSMTEGAENFNIYIKQGDVTLCHRQFNAKLFPPKVRYTVDVRPYIKGVLKELTDIFSAKNLSFQYMNYSLV